MNVMAAVTDSVKTALHRRLDTHRADHWPQIRALDLRFRGQFAYLDAIDPDGEAWQLCRLRYLGHPDQWGFAVYLASRDGYEDSVLQTGSPIGTPEEALDCAAELYLTAW